MNLLRADRLAIGRKGAIAVALGKDTEKGNSVGNGGQIGVEGVLGTETGPNAPEVLSGVGIVVTQSVSGLFLDKAE